MSLSKSGPTPSVSSVRCFTGKEEGNGITWKKKVVSFLQEGQGFLFILFYNTWLTDGQDSKSLARVKARCWGCSLKVPCLTMCVGKPEITRIGKLILWIR